LVRGQSPVVTVMVQLAAIPDPDQALDHRMLTVEKRNKYLEWHPSYIFRLILTYFMPSLFGMNI
jgi:hypothetical protein